MSNIQSLVHITAGSLALVAGAVALFARKGATLHRRSGIIFVWTMLLMSATGAVMAVFKPEAVSVVAGTLTFYLVATALLTVRRPVSGGRWMDVGAMLAAIGIGASGVHFGLEAQASAGGTKDGFPPAPYFIFATVALVAALLDARMLLRGTAGQHRLARHLWRMCFALLIAAASFFLGQADVFPEAVRIPALLAIPVLCVLLLMLYWLARVLFTRRYRHAG